MIRPKTHHIHQIHKLFNPQNPKPLFETHLIPLIYTKSFIPISLFSRSISLSSQFQHEFDTKPVNRESNKSLEAFFKEAVGLETENEEVKESSGKLKVELSTCKKGSMKEAKISKRSKTLFKDATGVSKKGKSYELDQESEKEVKESSGKLKVELRTCKKGSMKEAKILKRSKTLFKDAIGVSKKGKSYELHQESEKGLKKLSNLFTSSGDQRNKLRNEVKKVEEVMEYKDLPPDMAVFAEYLHKKGYLINANFLRNNKFNVSCFVNNYGRDFLKFAAERFAKDHREINKWLPDGDLKKVAQFGCPSLVRKIIFSAKSMRFHFGIQEETVCNKCTLKESCKFANQSVWKAGAKNIDLPVVMRVITLYALETVPSQLKVPDDIKNAVNRLLKEVIRLSELES